MCVRTARNHYFTENSVLSKTENCSCKADAMKTQDVAAARAAASPESPTQFKGGVTKHDNSLPF